MIPELTADKIAVFSAIIAVGSLIVAVVSICVAAKSAAAARQSAKAATGTLRRSIVRDLLGSCQATIDDGRAIHSLADRLVSERNDLSMFNGTLGGDRPKLYLDEIAKRREIAEKLANEAKRISFDSTALYNASDEDVDKSFFKLEKDRGEIRSIRDELERDLNDILAQNHQHREWIEAKPVGLEEI
jgi:hypothetical protein